METKDVLAYRKQAKELGLILSDSSLPDVPCYYFDLNQGPFYSEKNPKVACNLVKLARDYAQFDSYGEHNALLSLVAKKSDLENDEDLINWSRPYYVCNDKNKDEWITLKDYLIKSGCDMDEINPADSAL